MRREVTVKYIRLRWATCITYCIWYVTDASNVIWTHQECMIHNKTLPNAQRTHDIQYFDSFNTFSSKQKLQKTLKSLPYFSFVLFGKGRARNTWNNFDKSMKQLKQIYVATLANSFNNLEKSMYQLCQIHVTTEKNPFTNFDKLMYYLKEIKFM